MACQNENCTCDSNECTCDTSSDCGCGGNCQCNQDADKVFVLIDEKEDGNIIAHLEEFPEHEAEGKDVEEAIANLKQLLLNNGLIVINK